VHSLSTADLLICVTAAQHDLVVLHDDKDFATAARCPRMCENAPSTMYRKMA